MVHSLLTLIVMERLADFSGSLFSCWEGPSHSTWVVQWFCKWLLFPCTDLEMLHPSGPHPLSTTTNRKTALIPLFPPDPLIQQNLLSPSLVLKWWSQEKPAQTQILMWPSPSSLPRSGLHLLIMMSLTDSPVCENILYVRVSAAVQKTICYWLIFVSCCLS